MGGGTGTGHSEKSLIVPNIEYQGVVCMQRQKLKQLSKRLIVSMYDDGIRWEGYASDVDKVRNLLEPSEPFPQNICENGELSITVHKRFNRKTALSFTKSFKKGFIKFINDRKYKFSINPSSGEYHRNKNPFTTTYKGVEGRHVCTFDWVLGEDDDSRPDSDSRELYLRARVQPTKFAFEGIESVAHGFGHLINTCIPRIPHTSSMSSVHCTISARLPTVPLWAKSLLDITVMGDAQHPYTFTTYNELVSVHTGSKLARCRSRDLSIHVNVLHQYLHSARAWFKIIGEGRFSLHQDREGTIRLRDGGRFPTAILRTNR